MKIAVKEVGKPLKVIETDEKYRDDAVRKYTGKKELADFVQLAPNDWLFLGVNEEGLLLNFPTNFLLPISSSFYPIQKMVGTAVFVRVKPVNVWEEEIWDFELVDLTEKDLQAIKNLLSEQMQNTLRKRFVDYGMGKPYFVSL